MQVLLDRQTVLWSPFLNGVLQEMPVMWSIVLQSDPRVKEVSLIELDAH